MTPKQGHQQQLTLQELSDKCNEINELLLNYEQPDYISAENELTSLFGSLGPSDNHLKNKNISECWGKLQEGMRIYENKVRFLASVCTYEGDRPETATETEMFTPWECCFEQDQEGSEAQAFWRIGTEITRDENGNEVRKDVGHVMFHAVIRGSLVEVESQGYETDLWPTWMDLVFSGANAGGDGVHRWWSQINYSVMNLFDFRFVSRLTRFTDRNRGFFLVDVEPNIEKEHLLVDESTKSKILPLINTAFGAPTVDHNGNNASFLCQYNVIPVPYWAPLWMVRKILPLAVTNFAKGFLAGAENVSKSEIHKERRQKDVNGLYKMIREVDEKGRMWQTENYGAGFRLLPKKIPLDMLFRGHGNSYMEPSRSGLSAAQADHSPPENISVEINATQNSE